MKDYKVQKGCANCAHCLQIGFDWPYYYCNVDKSLPKYNEVPTMNHSTGDLFETEKERTYAEEEEKELYEKVFMPRCDLWHQWQNEHTVKPHGLCSLWETTIQDLEDIVPLTQLPELLMRKGLIGEKDG